MAFALNGIRPQWHSPSMAFALNGIRPQWHLPPMAFAPNGIRPHIKSGSIGVIQY
ncbi:MAG: hypothetical protein F6K23_00390 [Okeania sp. SIO2C9]|uniref:hypothetical protein n=1 Tax=Okeania sp. SIO2C9 TaxID=2607791 RepID=UPI0013C005D2|nr:hypothetical protein [Okeania sp. SIO2C9]NEQ71670.1 hypothetical protein [Okeania sp. SIO2C9]